MTWRVLSWALVGAGRGVRRPRRPSPPALAARETQDPPERPCLREYNRSMLRTVTATRYVTPLREGGSLPAIVEADDLGTYVLKFRGAGQGRKALIAELVAGGIGRALGLSVPEIASGGGPPALGRGGPC